MTQVTEKEMYALGQLTRCVWQDGEVPPNILSYMLAYPTKGIGMAHNTKEWRKADQEEIARLMAKLPAEMDESNPVPEGTRGAFWNGFYQYAALRDKQQNLTADSLAEIGGVLWGEHWQTKMAEALELSSPARIRQWLTGGNVPFGVWAELDLMLRARGERIDAIRGNIGKVATRDADAPKS